MKVFSVYRFLIVKYLLNLILHTLTITFREYFSCGILPGQVILQIWKKRVKLTGPMANWSLTNKKIRPDKVTQYCAIYHKL